MFCSRLSGSYFHVELYGPSLAILARASTQSEHGACTQVGWDAADSQTNNSQ